jgi:putative amidoligase enzyme
MLFNYDTFIDAPHDTKFEDKPRHIGVEIEFGNLTAKESAEHVQKLFGGKIEESDKHRYLVKETSLGDFICELDSEFVHNTDNLDWIDTQDIKSKIQEVVGDISAVVVPCEVVCPPIELNDLPKLVDLLDTLHKSGAKGTAESPLFGFGFQLNPEIAKIEADYICAIIKAHLLLSDWLRATIKLDLTRQVTSFTNPFPKEYIRKVLAPDYWPDMNTLIDDYLRHNPTRNRELDMLPLFSWIDDTRVKNCVEDTRIKSRPTFHYRLPNANLGQKDWSLRKEWNRWCIVEQLAHDTDRLNAMGEAYLENSEKLIAENWAIKASEWLLIS